MTLTAQGLGKSYGEQRVLRDVHFTVRGGETFAIVGRSGCGKTTLLRLLAGFLQPDEGSVLLDGREAGAPDANRLMVFQSFDQLFPWMTVRQNVLYALRKTRPELTKKQAREAGARCVAQMGLTDAEHKYPYQLSGGMKQRGAMARAIAVAPRVLLMDEPFSSLDVCSRENAREMLSTFQQATGAAVVLVTHDLAEAAALATRIALMKTETKGIFAMMDNRVPSDTAALESLLRE